MSQHHIGPLPPSLFQWELEENDDDDDDDDDCQLHRLVFVPWRLAVVVELFVYHAVG
jgi:hypothetical protein